MASRIAAGTGAVRETGGMAGAPAGAEAGMEAGAVITLSSMTEGGLSIRKPANPLCTLS